MIMAALGPPPRNGHEMSCTTDIARLRSNLGNFPEGGWLLQVEDIASGERHYFSDIRTLTGYVDEKLRTNPDP